MITTSFLYKILLRLKINYSILFKCQERHSFTIKWWRKKNMENKKENRQKQEISNCGKIARGKHKLWNHNLDFRGKNANLKVVYTTGSRDGLRCSYATGILNSAYTLTTGWPVKLSRAFLVPCKNWLSSVRGYSSLHWTSHFLQGTRKTRPLW